MINGKELSCNCSSASNTDKKIFKNCCHSILIGERDRRGIGTLGEKTLHAIIKSFIEPDTQYHEQNVGRFVADICKNGEITEIQTRNFSALRNKLSAYTPKYRVNIVYPIAAKKYISWIDPENGDVSERHKSPKQGKPWDILYELYALRPVMPLEGVRFTLLFCNIDEFRLLSGRSRDKKHFGASRYERIPTELVNIMTLEKTADFAALIPSVLGDRFTAAEFAKAAKMTRRTAGYALQTLVTLGVIEHTDTVNKAYIYKRLCF